MDYNIKGTDITLTPEVRGYVDKCLSRVSKLLPAEGPLQIDVEVEFSAIKTGQRYRAEFNVKMGNQLYRAESRGDALHEALDLAADELLQELRKAKGKRLAIMHRQAAKIKNMLKGLWGR